MAESQRYYVKIGGAAGDVGEVKFGFVAPKYAYEGIKDELGVIEIADNASARGVSFGTNYPKPPVVKILAKRKESGKTSSQKRVTAKRYCDPDKIGRVLNGSMNDADIKIGNVSYNIVQVTSR